MTQKKMKNLCGFLYFVFFTASLFGLPTTNGNVADHTSFCLYNREAGNKCLKLVYNDRSTIKISNMDVTRPIKILIPGWFDPLYNGVKALRKAYLATQEVNVITLDWFYYTLNARAMMTPVAKVVAQFIDWLVTETGVPVGSLHVVGFSLGGQLAGVVGEYVTVGKIGRITGLDPVGVTFSISTTRGRLDPTDAMFVDVIHTCDGAIGFSQPCGHVDFYPNGGTFNQPGCPTLDFGFFSHLRAFELFVESLSSYNFIARACDTWKNYDNGLCSNATTAIMGEHVNVSARGKFFLLTASKSPFALSEYA